MKNYQSYLEKSGEIGYTQSATRSLAIVDGLPGIKPKELVVFETGELGQALVLKKELVEVLLFSPKPVRVGTAATRTGEKLTLPVGEALLGQVINPLCQPINGSSSFKMPSASYPTDQAPWGIEKRVKIKRPLETGLAVVDLLLPLGQGQRELAIGDRKTGKTSFAEQVVLGLKGKNTVCIYTLIAKRAAEAKRLAEIFQKASVHNQTVIIAAPAEAGSGLVYLAPFSAITIAEYFRDQGQDTLVIFDDLTTHAKFYREIALLAKRFPGRDSYPADIFFTHARIMERGGNFKTPKGEASITLLPLAETTSGDLTGYIQTNLMSMTDGHLFFDRDLFVTGQRPAINPFLSVTRVGRQTQTPLKREISRELLAFLSLHEKMQSLVHFGAELTEEVRSILAQGERVKLLFQQDEESFVPANLSFYLLALLWKNPWPEKTIAEVEEELAKLVKLYREDEDFRQKVNHLMEKEETLAKLLEKINHG
ncbi:F0F1 ATP synthase subunit alpha [Candidatus Shapirobacteria bacterium]|nr:F0F1 ATP synthase subunit alpha [Candidatus Shapirobacteria bacterium]